MDPIELRAPLDAAALRAELIGTGLGWRRLDVVEQTGSTNADLLARAAAGDRRRRGGAASPSTRPPAAGGTAADGRPRRGPRSPCRWVSASVDVPAAGWGWLPLATGVAVVDAVAPLLAGPGLRWA